MIVLHANDRASARIVTPDRAGKRHGITIANSHTWCGIDTSQWSFDRHTLTMFPFDPATMTCGRCVAIWRRS